MTLNQYSHEKHDQRQMMELADKHFDLLKEDYHHKRVLLQTSAVEIKKKYNNPLGIRKIADQEVWLYRYPVWYKKSDKIYLTFNAENQLVTIEFVEDK